MPLVKQCWCLIQEPESLWARVLKARYFPLCSFIVAKRGGRASWAWLSLLTGRDILLKGSHWQVMNMKKIRIWSDKWLPVLLDRHSIPSGTVQVSRNTTVDSLINPASGDWDIEFLRLFISLEEVDTILESGLLIKKVFIL